MPTRMSKTYMDRLSPPYMDRLSPTNEGQIDGLVKTHSIAN
jgi:hypothetical protein